MGGGREGKEEEKEEGREGGEVRHQRDQIRRKARSVPPKKMTKSEQNDDVFCRNFGFCGLSNDGVSETFILGEMNVRKLWKRELEMSNDARKGWA